MPYIKQEYRGDYEPIIRFLVDAIRRISTAQANDEKKMLQEVRDGHVNYIITRILKEIYAVPSYTKYNSAIGVLECVKQEFYRRVVAPYEDQKIAQNGDVL